MHSCSEMRLVASPRRQRGDMLLEAMIGVLITALMGAGMAHVASRIMSSQYEAAVDALVVNDLRNVMQVSGVDLCESATPLTEKRGLPSGLKSGSESVSFSLAPCDAPTEQSLQIGGVNFEGTLPPVIQLTASKGGRELFRVSSAVAPEENDK